MLIVCTVVVTTGPNQNRGHIMLGAVQTYIQHVGKKKRMNSFSVIQFLHNTPVVLYIIIVTCNSDFGLKDSMDFIS